MAEKVTRPDKIVTDSLMLRRLAEQGIDKDYVEFSQDYAPRSLGKEHSPYAKFYRDLKSNKRFMVVSGLPMVKPDGTKIQIGWLKQGSRYVTKPNLFSAVAEGTKITVTCLNDQSDNRKKGDVGSFQPQLYLNNSEQLPVSLKPTLLLVDPVNPDLRLDTLEWDYGICKRRLRVIQGRIRGSWVFDANPNGEVRVKYNQIGNFKLKLRQFKVNDDEEIIPQSAFDEAEYPFTVRDDVTYYPDAHTETDSVDGQLRHQGVNLVWADLVNELGNSFNDTFTADAAINIRSSGTSSQWENIYRGIFLFDSSGLPDNADISAATFSLYGSSKYDNLSITPDINVYSSAPASPTALEVGDFDSLGNAAYSDTPVTYAGWSVAGYNDFALNATGIAAISKISVTEFGTRNASYDVEEEVNPPSAPSWTSSQACGLSCYFADNGTNKPKLFVTFTLPAVPPGGSPLAQMIQAGII